MKIFQFSRRLFAMLNAQCLISGAFGVFRKSTLLEINEYDIDTVGEDMELILRLQEQCFHQSKNRLFMNTMLYVILEYHIVSKDYLINERGGKDD